MRHIPQLFPLTVASSSGFKVYDHVNVDGHIYIIGGIDDRTNTLLVYPMGPRTERRKAMRKMVKLGNRMTKRRAPIA